MTEWILSSSILILIVIALRKCFKGRISLRLQYAIWGLVLLRLLIPFSFGSTDLSVANLTNKTEAPAIVVKPAVPNENLQTDHPVQQPQTQPLETPSQVIIQNEPIVEEEKFDLGAYAVYILWGVGFAAVAGLFLITNTRFKRKLMDSRYGLDVRKGKLKVYATDEIETPCLFGLWNPAIYVPYAVADEATLLRHSLEHEATHYRHGDHIWAVCRCVCLAVHWYNPLVWWAAFLSQRDAELACDEATIKRLGEGERAEYGRTLIGMTCRKKANVLTTATTMNSSRKGLKERIMLIAKKPKMALYTLLIVALAASIAVGCTFTGAKTQETEDLGARGEILDKNGEVLVVKDLDDETTPTTEPPATEIPDNAPPEATIGLPELGTLYEELDENKVCIAVQPTALSHDCYDLYYIIPENQALLQEYYQAAVSKKKDLSMNSYVLFIDSNVRMAGWRIFYQGEEWMVMEDGSLHGGKTIILAEDAKDLYEFCKKVLTETGISEPVRAEEITNISSATLSINSGMLPWTGVYTVTDPNALKRLETILTNSRYEYGYPMCPFTAHLELTLDNGELLLLAMGTDSCAGWMSEGVFYSYGEITNVGINGNEEFYSLFATDIIHEKAQEGLEAMEEYWIYMHWGLYANKYGHEDTMELLYMFEDYILSDPADWKICRAITSAATADGAYAEFMSYLLAKAYEAAPGEFSFACRQMLPEEDVNRAVNMLAYEWNISPEEVRNKLEL